MAGDEVDAGDRPAAVALVQVGGAADPVGELAQAGRLAAPEVAYRVPEAAVPLRPQWREVAHLVPAGAHVPRLGDELGRTYYRILLHHLEERGQPVHLVELAGQRRREV